MNHDSTREVIESARRKPSAFHVPGLRWWMMSLIMLGSILNYLSRQRSRWPRCTSRIRWASTEEQYSWITGAFQLAIMLQPICGYVLDVVGLRIGLAIFVAAWSVINMAHGLAGSWRGPGVPARADGFRGGSANPAGMKATAEWFPARERGLAGGIYNIGASAGIDAGRAAGGLLRSIYMNWQSAFVISGGLGLVWVGLWLLLLSIPLDGIGGCRRKSVDHIASGQEKSLDSAGKPSIREILKQRNFWGIAIPRFLADPMWGTLSFWLPLYLAKERHWDLKDDRAVFLAAVPGGGFWLHLRRAAWPRHCRSTPAFR